jgi:3-hydroxyacyl-[acyl-carrier-protein] dehydratase
MSLSPPRENENRNEPDESIAMLRDNLYTLDTIEKIEGKKFEVEITLDTSHAIFKGHFPGQPVLPGVCLIEMLKEMLIEITGAPCRLHTADTIKYLKMVDPRNDIHLKFNIEAVGEAQGFKVNATSFLEDGTPNFKFKGSFI